VTIVVVVFIINCHVSEKFKSGPEVAHKRIKRKARTDVTGFPATLVTIFENRSNTLLSFFAADDSIIFNVLCVRMHLQEYRRNKCGFKMARNFIIVFRKSL